MNRLVLRMGKRNMRAKFAFDNESKVFLNFREKSNGVQWAHLEFISDEP